jgi:hypothetical protein
MAQQQARQQGQNQGSALARIVGSVDDASQASQRLHVASERYHLVSPSTSCPDIPEGMSLAIASVVIDPEHDTHPVGGGKLGLGKSTLDRIGAALGISWDPRSSGRTDDGSHPHYCCWQAVGVMTDFSGVQLQMVGSKEMDLRDVSQAALGASSPAQLDGMRLHIMSHAETKARLRAIRSMGVRSSYEPEELRKPFVVARMIWTGRTDDPELRRTFAVMRAESMLGGMRSLYGGAPALPTPATVRQLSAPPAAAQERPRLTSVPATGSQTQRRAGAAASLPSDTGALTMPYGRAKGTPITEAEDGDLSWLAGRTRQKLEENPDGRYAGKDRQLLAAIETEMGRRTGVAEAHGEFMDGAPDDIYDDSEAY